MKKSDILKQQRMAKLQAQKTIVDAAETSNRGLTPEEQTQIEAMDKEVDNLDSEIARELANEARQLRFAEFLGSNGGSSTSEELEVISIQKRASMVTVLRGLSNKNGYKLEGAEKELHEIGLAENRSAGVNVPEDTAFSFPINTVHRATQQTVSQDGGEYGGELVQDQSLRMVEGLRPSLFLEELGASFFMGLIGGDLPLITSDSFKMQYAGEVEEIDVQKGKFGGKKLSPKRTAGAFDISNRLLMQSSIDVENWILKEMRTGLGVVVQSGAINGTGLDNQPTGLLQMTGVNLAEDTAAVEATWKKIVELQSLIEESNSTDDSLGYLIHPRVKAVLKCLVKDPGAGQFIFNNKMIDDLNTKSSMIVPNLSGCYPIIFGDWSQLFMGQWGAINIQANPYSADRANATRFVINTYTDSNIVNEKAFAVNKFIKG
ncbi:phage major capsid protein [Myroides odoratimimus]|uniref:phage major capsid protein n=1 Tax=Myroides odoratimimus TaxID=76832 RepID=UPI0025761463|nr:phage major capsid protein [Myroides odoratimimus]MDM1325908.1 phage major capsid protein [Myroides odoratimimus]MDM1452187.1 phage major capsid protein [Myroides odoratimimus]MDM1475474.1 phage major capsid protein [Myroides odoratimimus]MDM1488239.1 phage major capsid protein [Myroides odoratimimus]